MQLSNEPAEALVQKLIDSSHGAFSLCGFASRGLTCFRTTKTHLMDSLGSDAMNGAVKLARQVKLRLSFKYIVLRHPSSTLLKLARPNAGIIGRRLSFHGNTLGTLSLSHNPARRALYEAILDHEHFHHVSPAYSKRFQDQDETEEHYVERLRQELEDKFRELGPHTVIGCKSILSLYLNFSLKFLQSWPRLGRRYRGRRSSSQRLLQRCFGNQLFVSEADGKLAMQSCLR